MEHVAHLSRNTICFASIYKNLFIYFLLYPKAQNPSIENVIEMDLYAEKKKLLKKKKKKQWTTLKFSSQIKHT